VATEEKEGAEQLLLELPSDGTCYNVPLTAMPAYPSAANPLTAKALGAFYTDSEVADFLSRWAIRRPTDSVIDPSFGGGVFLRSACERIRSLGGTPASQVHGVELDKKVFSQIVSMLQDEFSVHRENFAHSDFFEYEPEQAYDAVVGNPPFIRYQRFSGESRWRALDRCARLGVKMSQLSSSWAPFLVCSTAMVRKGGRLAMVIPMELTYATYAGPVAEFLRRSFARISILTFRKRLFPSISEDTVLLLASGKGLPHEGVFHQDLPNAGALSNGIPRAWQEIEQPPESTSLKLSLQFVDPSIRALYQDLRRDRRLLLGEHSNVGIGYVTGGNSFFHLNRRQVEEWRIPSRFLKPAVLNGKAFSGSVFSKADLNEALNSPNAAYLLHINGGPVERSVRRYLRDGMRRGVSRAYKCLTRSPWYKVPHVYQPDCLLTYMSGQMPRLVANDAGAVAPNTLHVVRLRNDNVSPRALAGAWLTSLTQLSAEVEGHALGGGMLKIEPREAARLILPFSSTVRRDNQAVSDTLDALVRSGDMESAQEFADKVYLQQGLGFSTSMCRNLREASLTLRARRTHAFK
jgi:adenine-specific DNA-methyltransferase